ncbi:MAG: BMC domain-containing protein [Clostridia bacterium]|nr:BMC domain-containing protein [Clostridia bacterium]
MKSLGMIEVSGVTGAIDCLDIMCKSADVEFVTWERKLGGRLVTVVVQGNVSAVTAAVDNAVANGIVKPCAHAVIASPHEETWRILQISAARIAQKGR